MKLGFLSLSLSKKGFQVHRKGGFNLLNQIAFQAVKGTMYVYVCVYGTFGEWGGEADGEGKSSNDFTNCIRLNSMPGLVRGADEIIVQN